MSTTTKQAAKKSRRDLGYINVRISKKAHTELLRRALQEGRTIIKQLDIILGV